MMTCPPQDPHSLHVLGMSWGIPWIPMSLFPVEVGIGWPLSQWAFLSPEAEKGTGGKQSSWPPLLALGLLGELCPESLRSGLV